MRKIDLACIVDDDPIFVFGIKKVMELANFCNGFLVFKNGREALDNLTAIISSGKKLPEILLLDLNMPILDGWQFLEEFTKIPSSKRITIYIVTSSVDPQDIAKAKSYELVSDYIVKPISVKRLKEILKEFETSQ